MAALSTGKPYTEQKRFDYILRTFNEDIEEHELVWHRDKKNRLISVITSNGWSFQFDDELPFELKDGMIFLIPKETYHRVIKGFGSLAIKIRE